VRISSAMDFTNPPLTLLALCDELLLHIFAFLDVPELLNTSRVCHRLRHISLDPILHAHRLQYASSFLSHSLAHRPPLASLLPPSSTIYLSSTHLAARNLSRSLISIKLNRSLSRRPSASSLVSSNILPEECCRHDPETGEVVWGGVAPSIIEVKRKIEREKLKDGLRSWIAGRAKVAEKRARGVSQREKPSVRNLVQRFARRGVAKEGTEPNWGPRAVEKRSRTSEPTRAHVLRLRKFWEGVGRQSQPV